MPPSTGKRSKGSSSTSFSPHPSGSQVAEGSAPPINRKAIHEIFICIFLSVISAGRWWAIRQNEKKIIPPRQGLQRPEHLISVIRNQVLVLSRNHLPAVEHDIEGVQNIHRAWQRWNAQQVVQRLWNMATSWPRAFEIPHNV